MEYIVFTDESYITDSRYQSLSACSFNKSYYTQVVEDIQNILQESNVEEFKWNKLKDAKYYFCAEKICNYLLSGIIKYQFRIDTLIWDTHDARHAVVGRDDHANFERMFFHLLNNSMKKRPKGSSWFIYPDKRAGINWTTVHDCLNHIGKRQEYHSTIFGDFFSDQYYSIAEFQEKHSHEELPIQIADLFSGLAVFSRESYSCYESYINASTPSLFEEPDPAKLTNREEYRCKLLEIFNHGCKKRKLGVSLQTNKYLYTYNPDNPVNFWHYVPQGDYDTAPLRNDRGFI